MSLFNVQKVITCEHSAEDVAGTYSFSGVHVDDWIVDFGRPTGSIWIVLFIQPLALEGKIHMQLRGNERGFVTQAAFKAVPGDKLNPRDRMVISTRLELSDLKPGKYELLVGDTADTLRLEHEFYLLEAKQPSRSDKAQAPPKKRAKPKSQSA
jgi:hypothetical protein